MIIEFSNVHRSKMRTLVLNVEHKMADVRNVSSPTPASTEILVRVEAISLNPIDPLFVAHPLASSGRTVGRDVAGRVEALGRGGTSSQHHT